jgi:molecular chaperone DnaJ
MAKRDYYEILGISKGASDNEIKSAFRNLARQYHPDVNNEPDAEDRFKEINEAYAVLSDQEKRDAYNRYGHAGVENAGGVPNWNTADFSDIFDELFGFGFGGFGRSSGGRSRNAPRRGADLQHRINLTFEEAVLESRKKSKLLVMKPARLVKVPAQNLARHLRAVIPVMGKAKCGNRVRLFLALWCK